MSLFGRVRRQVRAATASMVEPYSTLFPEQLAVVMSLALFKALLCGRRAGKTRTAMADFAHGMLHEPGSLNLFVALTIASAREILWEPFKKENEKYGWGFAFDESKMIVKHANGSRLIIRGADDIRALEKLRGMAFRRVRIDECGAWRPSYLQYFVEEVIEPTLMDHAGDVWLMGTPTAQAIGFFYEITTGAADPKTGKPRTGYEVFHWTAERNPHVRWHEFIFDAVKGLLARRGWTTDHPIFRREYLAEWVTDTARLIYRFLRDRNVIAALPPLAKRHDRWRKVLALDFGVNDATASVVLQYPEIYGRWAFATHAWKRIGLAPSDAADLIAKDVATHQPDVIVGDTGGIGKAFVQELNKRYPKLSIQGAKKPEKRARLEIMSDALHVASLEHRRGLFIVAGNGTEDLQRELATLLWNETREDIADGQDDDLANALQYGFGEVPAFENASDGPPEMTQQERDYERAHQDDDEPPERPYYEENDL